MQGMHRLLAAVRGELHHGARYWVKGVIDILQRMKPPQLTKRRAKFQAPRSHAPQAALLAMGLMLGGSGARAQADFQIVWVVIGEAAGAVPNEPLRAGRHLFMASELAAFSLQHVQVAKVEAQPPVVELAVGEQFCVTSLNIAASTATGTPVKHAPLTISVRQDHKEALGLDRRKDDICVKGISAGEFAMRFTSMLPAKDGTTRGAQVFLRIRN